MVRNTLSLFALFILVLTSSLVGQSLPFYEGSYQEVQQLAEDKQQPFIVYLFKHNSKEHRKMLRKTWSNKQVKRYLAQHYQVGRVNVFSGKEDAKLVQKHQVFKLPSTLVFTPEGKLIGKVQGFAAPTSLKSILVKHELFVKEKSLSPSKNIPPLIASAPATKNTPPKVLNKPTPNHYRSAEPKLAPAKTVQQTRAPKRNTSPQTASVAKKSYKTLSRGQSRGQSQLHLDVPGMHEYSLINKGKDVEKEMSLGLLIGSYTSYKQLRQMVTRFQRVWKGNMWVFAEEVNQIPVYKLVLGDYSSREEAEIFANVIYKIDKSNPSILDLTQLVN